MSPVPSWEAGMEDATCTDLASWPQMPCSCVVQASSPRGAEHPARTTSTYRILLNTNTTPEPPRGHPCPSSPPAAPRTVGQGTRRYSQPRQSLVVLEEELGQGVQLVAVQPSVGKEERVRGWGGELPAPPRAQFWLAPARTLPGDGSQLGINRFTHNIAIRCRQDSKLLAADCCLTALLTCCSPGS